ncbi:MAG: hypothetical protein Q8M25_14125 [Rhodoferax sp.]|nr:hypothetical protein [Rhodoferax sp.]
MVLTLPASGVATDEALYDVRRIDATANTVTFAGAGADTIDGAAAVGPLGHLTLRLPAGSTVWRAGGLGGATPAAAKAMLGVGPGYAFKNRLINGGMTIDQRNNAAAQTFTAAAVLAYCVDRWYGYCTGANVTGQQIAGSAPNLSVYRFTGAASVTAIGFGQRIERANCFDLAGTTAMLSVQLANSLLTTVAWAAYYATTNDTFGTLAAPTRTLIANGTFTVSATLATYSAQIAVPGAATTGIEIVLSVGAQVSGTWTIGAVQLEPGSMVTDFERLPPQVNLALCQRRAIRVETNTVQAKGYVASNGQSCEYAKFYFPVQMAAAPITPTVSWAGAQFNTPTFSYKTTQSIGWDVTGTGGTVYVYNSAAFILDSEL